MKSGRPYSREMNRIASSLRAADGAVCAAWNATFLIAIVFVGASCSQGDGNAVETDSTSVASAGLEAHVGPPRDTVGSGSVNWSLPALHTTLCNLGLNPVVEGEVRQQFMGEPGVRYKLNGGELQAYIYADAGAVARDTDQLDTATVSPRTMMIHWRMRPALIISNNLVLILLTNDPELRDTIRAAVTPDLLRHDVSQ
jgi:hypothetical protein